ncbi:MAG TPA: LCP family protein [Candidatus Saccharimonadales bacterium]|nr:LCP family protein [Candidatus Saccharimonadales bacterium]
MEQNKRRPKSGSMDGFLRPSMQPRKIPRTAVRQGPINPSPRNTLPTKGNSSSLPYTSYYKPAGLSETRRPLNVTPPKQKKHWSVKRKIIMSALTILLIGFGVGSWYGARLLGNLDKVFHGNIISDAQALFSNTKLKGEDQGRVNILLAGDSADDPNHGGAQLTDSIMVLSIDTKNHTGFMLSIPRDLWVDIPGWSHQKINAANDVTNFSQQGYPKGGMGQLQQIVQSDLGIPIDYYALINYTAFKDSVNAVGGISINIQSNDPRGLFDPNIAKADGGPLKLPNGEVTLDGQTALNLARARGDPCGCGQYEYGFPQSDYNRTQHQRQMLVALAQKAQSVGVLANPIKVTNLFNSFGNNVATDLNLQDVLRFIQLSKGLNLTKLQTLDLPNSGPNALITSYTAPDGEEALIPKAGIDNFSQIQYYYQQLTSDNPIVREAPTVVVLNGGSVAGLARKEAAVLKNDGFQVIGEANTNSQYSSALVVDSTNGNKPASKQSLQNIFKNSEFVNASTASTEAEEASGYSADFVVILGQDVSLPAQH